MVDSGTRTLGSRRESRKGSLLQGFPSVVLVIAGREPIADGETRELPLLCGNGQRPLRPEDTAGALPERRALALPEDTAGALPEKRALAPSEDTAAAPTEQNRSAPREHNQTAPTEQKQTAPRGAKADGSRGAKAEPLRGSKTRRLRRSQGRRPLSRQMKIGQALETSSAQLSLFWFFEKQ